MNRTDEIRAIEPTVVQREGGWFAASPLGALLRVGVEGTTEEAVRRGFKRELEAWAALREVCENERRGVRVVTT